MMIGRILYVVTLPGIWLVIKNTPPRTRIVVVFDGKVLLTRDWLGNGKWNLPGGGLHKNENPRIGAIRELKEETNIIVQQHKLKKLKTFRKNETPRTAEQICYWTQLLSEQRITLPTIEILDYMWIDIEDTSIVPLNALTEQILATFREEQSLLH